MRALAYAAASALVAVMLAGCGADEPDADIIGDWSLTSGRTADGELVAPGDGSVCVLFKFIFCNN